MTREEILKLSASEIEARKNELAKEAETATTERLAEIGAELDAIEERSKALSIKARAAKAVASGAGQPFGTPAPKTEKRTLKEVRDSREYVEAFAKYIRTNKDMECRALLTENVAEIGENSGPVPVPTFIEEKILRAWENSEIWSKIRKTYVPGNVKVGFEVSSTDAAVHLEGGEPVPEEKLLLGVVTLVPTTIKKWITVSDEVLALGAYDMLAYLYDEIAYKIIQFAEDTIIKGIAQAATNVTSDAVGFPIYGNSGDEITVQSLILAKALLGPNARDLVVICSRAFEAQMRVQALGLSYPVDPFDGMTVVHSAALPDNTSEVRAIIGDLSGVLANLPEGNNVRFKFDDLSLSEKDLVKIVGRLMVAVAPVEPGMFVRLVGVDSSGGDIGSN